MNQLSPSNIVFNNTGGYTHKNSVRLIQGGAHYFDLLEELIRQARESIHFQIYIYEDDTTGNRISNALMDAAQRGVSVYLLLDGYASRLLKPSTLSGFQKAGIHFRWFEPLFKGTNFFIGRRMHHKVFVADNFHSLVGGLNVSDRYNDMPGEPAWLDWAVYVMGEISIELHNRCVQMWFRRPPVERFRKKDTLTSVDKCFIRMRINDWVRNKNQISRSYLEMFRNAQSNITLMSSYFMPGRVFRKNLRLAAQRGIKIRIILTKISDVPIAKQAERFFYPWLLRKNIEVYEYKRKVLHGKMASCDNQWVTVGSYNFNDLSAYASIELNLDVHNKQFSEAVNTALENIIINDCDRITEESLIKNTHWWNTLAYRIAYTLGRFFLFAFTFSFSREHSIRRK